MEKNKRFITTAFERTIPENVEESRIINFVLSTTKKDRHNTIIEKWNLDNYRKNPVVFYQHNDTGLLGGANPDFVIGKSVHIAVENSGGQPRLVAGCQFEPASINPLAEKIFQKLLFGSLSATSVGFVELEQGYWGKGDEAISGSNPTYRFGLCELLEWSIVNIPSNPDAGVRTIADIPKGAINYTFSKLKHFKPSDLEKMSQENILTLLAAQDYPTLSQMNNPYQVIAKMRLMKERQTKLMELAPGCYEFDQQGRFIKIKPYTA